ncbi:acyl-CoA carboxylase epsilon subunit [Kitasatospora sp. NPDC004614]|uniref:acyl-CoA carboxylase epsilon subunit n=1 Tax=unclassified Kitasatospora TaxID=2633591 RepID=UPI00369207BE
MTPAADHPAFRIVRGNPGPEELAVLTAVLAALAARPPAASRFAHGSHRPRARWLRPERLVSYRNPVSWR